MTKDTPQGAQAQAVLCWIDEKTGGALRKAVEQAGAEYTVNDRINIHADMDGKCEVRGWVDGVEVYRFEYADVPDGLPDSDVIQQWTFYKGTPAEGVS